MSPSTMTEPSNEDVMVVPSSWRRTLHPRHGGAPGPALKLNGRMDSFIYEGLTPEEAAAMALRAMPRYDDALWVFVDAWVGMRGVVFAAAATMRVGHDGTVRGSTARHEAFQRMRRHLAAANDEDYAEAVAALAGFRRNSTARLLVSYLVPTEEAWAQEVCSEAPPGSYDGLAIRLIPAIVSTPAQLACLRLTGLLRSYETDHALIITVAEGLGAAALPLFDDMLAKDSFIRAEMRKSAFNVVAQLPGDDAFEMLASRLDEKHVPGALLEAMARFPIRAMRLLAKTANGATALAPTARRLLAGHVRAHADLVDAVLPGLPEPDAKLIAELARQSAGKPEASADTLPPLLVAPPWTRPRDRSAEPAVLDGLEPPPVCRAEWAPGEQEAWAAKNRYRGQGGDWEVEAKLYAESGFGPEGHARRFFAEAPDQLTRPLLARWRPNFSYENLLEVLGPLVARYEEDALRLAVTAANEASLENAGRILQPLVDPVIARMMANWFLRYKSGRDHAATWLTRHAPTAALLLIPDALGRREDLRAQAQHALRLLAPTDVRAAAAHYGPQAVTAVEQILTFDPLDQRPKRMPTAPAWLENASLPQILLRGRASALPADAVHHVLSMLAISKPGMPYPGLAIVREAADPLSLAEFAWSLFETWQTMDLPAKDGWVLTALGYLGDDDTARRLAPLIRAWPGEGGHQRAVAGLDVLAELGTDVALMQLHQIAQRVKFKALKDRAQAKIAEIAQSLGLTADQLSDRLVPDFGLDAEGGTWLDYGPRRFRVGFDAQLKPFVVDEAGSHRKVLPPPNTKDDADLAAAARQHFSSLKKDVRTVADGLIRRLEAAMANGRTWNAAEFRDLLVRHPLVWHIARRLVWLGGDGGAGGGVGGGVGVSSGSGNGSGKGGDTGARAQTAFRIAEDRTLATVGDEPYMLADDAQVRLAHPLHLGSELAAWSEVFADYEILQPFAQLGRPVYALTEQERGESRLARFEGLRVPTGRVLGLVQRGWERGTPMDAGVENNISRAIGEGVHLIVDLYPGIAVGFADGLGEDQTLREIYLSTQRRDYWHRRDYVGPPLGVLDPVTASEVLNELTRLTSGESR